ncbi:prepilin-type N-terminal cleavage/methylation domain-containing protein [Desulfosporosinus sp. SYSU MS00001]|uniref:prepilin-type N-terminal cleavage/methylation domain-containing protein n=1 Tax=Desulfosporosinus sp. SYSU MS00001 TaxID=3416284 RepID=UPI003CF8DDDA
MRQKRNDGFTLIELMMVIAIIGILAIALIPQFGDAKTAAKVTGIETNIRSVVIAISGMPAKDDIGDNLSSTMEDMANPITNEKGVDTLNSLNQTNTKAIYVFETEDKTWEDDPNYNGAIVVYSHEDHSADVFAIDKNGESIEDLHATVER